MKKKKKTLENSFPFFKSLNETLSIVRDRIKQSAISHAKRVGHWTGKRVPMFPRFAMKPPSNPTPRMGYLPILGFQKVKVDQNRCESQIIKTPRHTLPAQTKKERCQMFFFSFLPFHLLYPHAVGLIIFVFFFFFVIKGFCWRKKTGLRSPRRPCLYIFSLLPRPFSWRNNNKNKKSKMETRSVFCYYSLCEGYLLADG